MPANVEGRTGHDGEHAAGAVDCGRQSFGQVIDAAVDVEHQLTECHRSNHIQHRNQEETALCPILQPLELNRHVVSSSLLMEWKRRNDQRRSATGSQRLATHIGCSRPRSS